LNENRPASQPRARRFDPSSGKRMMIMSVILLDGDSAGQEKEGKGWGRCCGRKLPVAEFGRLPEQRQLADDTHHCPHGRPTALLFRRHDLERQFRRV